MNLKVAVYVSKQLKIDKLDYLPSEKVFRSLIKLTVGCTGKPPGTLLAFVLLLRSQWLSVQVELKSYYSFFLKMKVISSETKSSYISSIIPLVQAFASLNQSSDYMRDRFNTESSGIILVSEVRNSRPFQRYLVIILKSNLFYNSSVVSQDYFFNFNLLIQIHFFQILSFFFKSVSSSELNSI